MEFFKPEIISLIVAVVGICEAAKKIGIKAHTVYISLFVSLLGGLFSALGGILDGDILMWQTAAVNAFVIYGGATLSYEIVLKRFVSSGNGKPR